MTWNPSGAGDLLRRKRKERGLTQGQVAEKLSVSQPSVAQWESGKVLPSGGKLARLAQLLGLSVNEWAERQFDVCDEVERAIHYSELTRNEQDALLAVYGVIADRPSLRNVEVLRFRPNGSGSEANQD